MERARRLRELWNWLPSFRAAAETEHLPTAAKLLHVGASSISRTVRLLEGELGVALFDRSGRSIRLNRTGEVFLAAVRDAMRIVDDGVDAVSPSATAGAVHLAVPRYLADVIAVPALDELAAKALDLVVHIHPVGTRDGRDLLRGQLDASVLHEPIDTPDVSVDLLCHLDYAVYASSGHPLAAADDPASSAADFAFAAAPRDGWPRDLPRRVGAHAPDPAVAADICAAGRLLASLPCAVAETRSRRAGLVRIPTPSGPPAPLFLAYRRPVADHARTNAILAALRNRARVAEQAGFV